MTDHAGYPEFAQAHWQRLVRLAVSLGVGHHEAEDLAQVTLLKTYVAWRRVRSADDPDAYVARILLNALREGRRRGVRRERPAEHVPDSATPDHADQVGAAVAVHDALASLSDDQRVVVALRYFADLTIPQIATALDLPPGTVKSRLSRAMAALARTTSREETTP